MRYFNFRLGALVAAVAASSYLFTAMFWAKHRDPFRQIKFSLATPRGGNTKGVAILPNLDARYPVVIYVHGSGESLMSIGKSLQQIAELGMAAVGIEYDQTNQSGFAEEFATLQNFVQRQPWAMSNAVAWVGMGTGARRALRFVLNHPLVQPQLLVLLSGGWDEELSSKFQVPSSEFQDAKTESGKQKAENPGFLTSAAAGSKERVNMETGKMPVLRCPLLLVHSDNDRMFSLEGTKRLAALLKTYGVSVNLCVLHGAGHDFGPDRPVVFRETAEYCRAHLPPADYTGELRGCQLNEAERRRFNLAMQRAGQHRPELWKAVISSHEPERHTLMMVIGGLEDYDLAHATASYLQMNVHLAWQARRTYPWCRKLPLDIFEKYVAGPRFFQEPIENWRPALNRLIRHEVKYCRTTQEASDKVWELMNEKVAFNLQESGGGIDPLKILEAGRADCIGLCILHAAMGRSVGLAERMTRVLWQNSLGEHFCVEIWSTEDQRWHEIDVSAGDRNFDNDWVMRVPKTAILAPTGDRGLWDGLSVGRWSSFSNTIVLVYPSGNVAIKVLKHGIPAPDRTVGIKLPTVKGLIYMALARTDINGEARLTLGRSAKYPYLFFVLPPDEAAASARYPYPFLRHNFGNEVWQWVRVQAGQTQEVVLNMEDRRPFNPNLKPPEVPKPAF
jgi:pimeloyl-ACP methyl ester carboxylesterase